MLPIIIQTSHWPHSFLELIKQHLSMKKKNHYCLFPQAVFIAVYMVLVLKKVEQDEDEDCIDIEPTFDNSSEMIKVMYLFY